MKKKIGDFLEGFFSHEWYMLATISALGFIIACSMAVHTKYTWHKSVNNPVNGEYVEEVAFNLGIPADSVSQRQFNARYFK